MSIKENSTKLILGTICEVETMNYWAQEEKNILEYIGFSQKSISL